MPNVQVPVDFEAIDQLIEASDFEACRELLACIDVNDASYEALRIKLALRDGSLEPAQALEQLIRLMRKYPDLPGARALYQSTSQAAYLQHTSSASLSHIPPAVKVAG